VLAGAAFRAAGRRDVDVLLVVRAGRGAASSVAAGTEARVVWVFSSSIMAAASETGPVDRVRSSGAGWPVNVTGTSAGAAVAAG
jgi:hypothetical protein